MTWLSKRTAQLQRAPAAAEDGVVSIGGAEPAVVTDGELRNAPLLLPGGYWWQPVANESVLVLRGARDCIAGRVAMPPADLAAGEVCIFSRGASIRLTNDGRIELSGRVFVNGKELKDDESTATG